MGERLRGAGVVVLLAPAKAAITVVEWFTSNWSESDAFKVISCVAAAVVVSLLVSNQRTQVISGLITLISVIINVPIRFFRWISRRLSEAALRTARAREAKWRDHLQPGCIVSFVEIVDDEYVVHRGRVAWIKDEVDVLIDWNPEGSQSANAKVGPDGAERSSHDVERITKEVKMGDRGVTVDATGATLINPGWSVLQWPLAPQPYWVERTLKNVERQHRKAQSAKGRTKNERY